MFRAASVTDGADCGFVNTDATGRDGRCGSKGGILPVRGIICRPVFGYQNRNRDIFAWNMTKLCLALRTLFLAQVHK